jgi:hypothetical protein
MKNLIAAAALALATTFVLTSVSSDAFAVTNREIAEQRAHCKHRAAMMKFGVHFIKRYRWIKECVAGKHEP